MTNQWRVTLYNQYTGNGYFAVARTRRQAFNRVLREYSEELAIGFANEYPEWNVHELWRNAFNCAFMAITRHDTSVTYRDRINMVVEIRRI